MKLYNRRNIAAGYTRLSKEDLKTCESESISNQKELIKEYCKLHDIELLDFYVDDGYSGGNFDRPGFNRLLKAINSGAIDTVITKDISRLGRDYIETSNYIFKIFPEEGIRYIAILDNYDSFKPNGIEDLIPFQTVINDMYLRDTSRKIKTVLKNKMKEGLLVGGEVPYGYVRSSEDNRKIVVDDYAASNVKKMFEMRLSGLSYHKIADYLNSNHIESPEVYSKRKPRGNSRKIWLSETVRGILRNETYTGKLLQGKTSKVSYKSTKQSYIPREEWIIKENTHEAIIDQATFDLVQQVSVNKHESHQKSFTLLGGKVYCKECGEPLLLRTKMQKKNKIKVFYCKSYCFNKLCSSHYIAEEKINEIVVNEINNLLLHNNVINDNDLIRKYQEVGNGIEKVEIYENKLQDAKSKLNNVEKALLRLYEDNSRGEIDNDDFDNIKRSLLNDKKQLKMNIDQYEYYLGKSMRKVASDEHIREMINQFKGKNLVTKELIGVLIDRVYFDKDKKITIYFNVNSGDLKYEN